MIGSIFGGGRFRSLPLFSLSIGSPSAWSRGLSLSMRAVLFKYDRLE